MVPTLGYYSLQYPTLWLPWMASEFSPTRVGWFKTISFPLGYFYAIGTLLPSPPPPPPPQEQRVFLA